VSHGRAGEALVGSRGRVDAEGDPVRVDLDDNVVKTVFFSSSLAKGQTKLKREPFNSSLVLVLLSISVFVYNYRHPF
jgi:hypothetical protein